MIDLDMTLKRMTSAVEQFESYTPTVYRKGSDFIVANKYTVNLNLGTCTCKDHEMRKQSTPCKHIIIVWLYTYAEIHQEPDPFHS